MKRMLGLICAVMLLLVVVVPANARMIYIPIIEKVVNNTLVDVKFRKNDKGNLRIILYVVGDYYCDTNKKWTKDLTNKVGVFITKQLNNENTFDLDKLSKFGIKCNWGEDSRIEKVS